jgi:hypothetical protein
VISPLYPCGNFMYRRFCTSKEYKYSITENVLLSCDSHNKKKIFPYAAIAGSFYNREGYCLLRGMDWLYRSQCNVTSKELVPWHRRLVDDLWNPRPGFGSKTAHQADVVEKKYGYIIGVCLSTSVLHCQYYSAHAVYSSSPNVSRIRRTDGHGLETFKRNGWLNV